VSDAATERWENVRRLFHEALERPAGDERTRFLESACSDDSDLRGEVESLLASHDRAGSFLESPILEAETGAAVLANGTRLGPYEITSLLGVGGMGEIYRARDSRLARDVAVKVLPAGLARNPERLARFEQEARAASALNHPHIVALYDVGRERGLAYIVTELLEGQTLAERIAQGPMPVRKALDYAVQAARGLAAAHERGIVHRDVKPANLFVTGDGQVKILDFGLAKLADPPSASPSGATPATTPGVTMGTVGYMSPEQVRGEAADFRSDQFSLGCVLYELLSGEGAFRRPTGAQTMAAVIEDEPAPLRERNPRVPEPVAWIVERCLSKDSAERYAATRDLARDLELATRRFSEPRVESMKATPKLRRRTLYGAMLAAALIALGAGAVWLWRPRLPAVPVVRFLTYSGHDSSPAASPDGRMIAFSSSREGHRGIWIKQLGSGNEVPLTEGEDEYPRFSPDGSVILFARREGSHLSLFRVPTVAGDARKLVDDALYGDFAPDGRICFIRQLLAPGETSSLVGLAASDGSEIRELARFPGALVHPRWSPDGKTIAVTETPLQVGEPTATLLIDPAIGRARRLSLPTAAGVWRPGSLVWTSPHEFLYSQPESVVGFQSGSSSRILLQNIRSKAAREVLWNPATILMIDVLGPGRLVFEARSLRQNLREFRLRSTAAGTEQWVTRGNSTDRQPVYSPDGEWLVFSSNRAGHLDLWALSRQSGAVRRLTDDEAEDWDPGFTKDGRLLWSSNRGGHFEIWRSEADGTGALQLSKDGVDAENPMATPDGKWILYASANPASRGIVRMRPDGSERTVLIPGNMILPELSPDGRYVAFVDERLGNEKPVLRVSRVADGAPTAFAAALPPSIPRQTIDVGRCRWFPDGRSLAFIGQSPSPEGGTGVFVQTFAPGTDTNGSRRWLVPLDPEYAAESLAISHDGTRLTVAYIDHLFNLMVAENVPDVERPPR
jgi:eukaryotic-like serine/threonine-protein kinase